MSYDWSHILLGRKRIRQFRWAMALVGFGSIGIAELMGISIAVLVGFPSILLLQCCVIMLGMRLNELKCPRCHKPFFVVDEDGFALRKNFPNYDRKSCVNCGLELMANGDVARDL